MSEYVFKANFKIDNCLTCPVENIVINCPCFTGEAHASDYCDSKHPNCPLKELPPHGDLGDISELYVDILADLQTSKIQTLQDVLKILNIHFKNAPTILEASEVKA